MALTLNYDKRNGDKIHSGRGSEELSASSNSSNEENKSEKSSILENMSCCMNQLGATYKCLSRIKDRVIFYMFVTWIYDGRLYNSQDGVVFQPNAPSYSRSYVCPPSRYQLPYQSGYIRSKDGTPLHYFFLFHPFKKTKAATILYFHGNAGNIGHRLQNASDFFYRLNCNVFLIEYRGYGKSFGVPNEKGFYEDACAALDVLNCCSLVDRKKIVIFGRSLGGSVAVDLASRPEYRRKIWCVILENTFTNIPDMAKQLLGWSILHFLPSYFYKNQFNSLKKIDNILSPTLFLCGLQDNIVPPRMMRQLYKSCGASIKQFISFPDGSHDDTLYCEGYIDCISHFLHSIEKPQKHKKKLLN